MERSTGRHARSLFRSRKSGRCITSPEYVNLTELSLFFQGNFEEVQDYNMVVEGDLVLPSLQVLQLHRADIGDVFQPDGDYSPVVLAHFTGTLLV